MTPAPDPADRQLDAHADGAFGGKPTVGTDCNPNRRAGYTDPLGLALRQARKGGTLQAGEGLLLVKHYEAQLTAALALAEQCLAQVRYAHAEATYLAWVDSASRRNVERLRMQLDALRAELTQSGPT